MIAATIAPLLLDGKNESPAPATDGRGKRRTVVYAVVHEGHHGEIGNFGVFLWAHADGAPVHG